ncbi:ATP-dependent DNA helicase [Kineococcus sp. SYSU DK006]|uniref:ATP-dependent DNA helicase n=1 Tax=Kineococcus sp. SYSU DK006 TaxID=3383127 RepID=UPI003D7E9CB0
MSASCTCTRQAPPHSTCAAGSGDGCAAGPGAGAGAGAPAPAGATALLRALVAERSGGETRPQQERLAAAVEHALAQRRHLLAQAGTGTGKTLGYLVPVLARDGRAVVSTATKQLSEQVVTEDLPLLARLLPRVGGRTFTHALLKGRSNYACLARIDALTSAGTGEAPGGEDGQDPGAQREDPAARRPSGADLAALEALLRWSRTTTSGDRSQAPPTTDRVWAQVSTGSAGCPGAATCPFGRECFAEKARATAREADVVVTNHAQLAHDLLRPQPLLGEHEVLVADEVHELEAHLSSAWGQEVAPAALGRTLALAAHRLPRGPDGDDARAQAEQAAADLEALSGALAAVGPGRLPQLPPDVADLLVAIADRLARIAPALEGAAHGPGAASRAAAGRRGAAQQVAEAAAALLAVLHADAGRHVRWLQADDGRPPRLRVAPLRVGPQLMAALGERTLVATSATIAVGGSFEPALRALGFAEPLVLPGRAPAEPRGFDVVDVGTPFDHERQAVLYVPPSTFPDPGRDRAGHTAAVLGEVEALVRAAGGRTLALFTTTRAAREAAAHLRATVRTPVLAQGEAPAAQLVARFTEVEESTLCATTGFWHGVNVPGPSLSCVVIDKVPFAPADDPLLSARREAADAEGRDGFHEVHVAAAAVMLAQGAGRLVRTGTDRGVVAVLDPRLRTRGYGRTLIASLPEGMRLFGERDVVTAALTRLTGGAPAAAVGGDSRRAEAAAAAPGAGPQPGAGSAARRGAAAAEPPVARRAAPRRATTRALARRTRASPPGP